MMKIYWAKMKSSELNYRSLFAPLRLPAHRTPIISWQMENNCKENSSLLREKESEKEKKSQRYS